MNRFVRWIPLLIALCPSALRAQGGVAAIQNHCYQGGTNAVTSGLSSTNFQQGIIPSCTVTVYLTGTQTKAAIFSNAVGTPLANPFTANATTSADPGGWIFWAAVNTGYDVVMNGGIAPNTYSTPVTLTDVYPSFQFSGGGGGGGNINGSTTANLGVGSGTVNNTLAPVPEVNYSTTAGVTTFACQEDQNNGKWDPRCIRNGASWASNPSQALVNTIQAAMCYYFTVSGSRIPVVQIPAGNASIGGNISLPPNLDLEGVGGTEFGSISSLTTNDPTRPMFTQVNAMTFNCGGTNFTSSSGTSTVGNISLFGGHNASPNDKGLVNNTGNGSNSYIHNLSFQNFGGTAYDITSLGQNSRGDHIFFFSDTQWYYNSGQYNTTGFTDTNPHCALNLGAEDSSWDTIEGYGQLQDSGYYNRFYLCGVQLSPGRTFLTNSFIQINPHDVWYGNGADFNAGGVIEHNRFDDGWWDSIHMPAGTANIAYNDFLGYCTSPTLNPANFPSNPGGVTTDANCSAIEIIYPGSATSHNGIGEVPGQWASWPVGTEYWGGNAISQVSGVADEPQSVWFGLIGQIGGDTNAGANPGVDVSRSFLDSTSQNVQSAGGTIHFKGFKHTWLNDASTSSYASFDGLATDLYVSIFVGTHDTVTPSATIFTCGGATLGPGIYWFWSAGGNLNQMDCGSGGGGGGVSGSGTGGFIPLWSGSGASTAQTNSPLDYGVTTANHVTVGKPLDINDGTANGGTWTPKEGTQPSTAAAGVDSCYADSTAHAVECNYNNTGFKQVPLYPIGTNSPPLQWYSSNTTTFSGTNTSGIGTELVGAPGSTFTIARIDMVLGTAGVGCTTAAVVSLYDVTTPASPVEVSASFEISLVNGTRFYTITPGSPFALTLAHNYMWGIKTATSGCSTSPSSPYWTVTYTVQ